MGTPPSPQHQSMTDIPRLRSSSEEMAKGKQCWLLPAHSNLKEAGNLAFLEAQGTPATNLLSSDSLYKGVLSCA